jgi:hypothetical protein
VQATLAPFTTVERPDGGYDVYLTAANLHVRNGLEATNGYPIDPESTDPAYILTNGLGNLIIGYDEAIGDRWDTATLQCVPWEESDRAGSHNIVLGINNGYPSFAGLVAGQGSYVGGPYAAVSAGQFNLADGVGTSVSGGWMNMASDSYASVSGGRENTASGPYAWVSGGHGNTADGYYASVSGGHHNAASGPSASVSGGYGRAASSNYDWAAGGLWEDQ